MASTPPGDWFGGGRTKRDEICVGGTETFGAVGVIDEQPEGESGRGVWAFRLIVVVWFGNWRARVNI